MATHHPHPLSRFAPKPIGAQHPRIRELLALRRNAPPSSRKIVVEGAWEHERLLGSGTTIGIFLWCPESASDRSAEVAERVAERATEVFRSPNGCSPGWPGSAARTGCCQWPGSRSGGRTTCASARRRWSWSPTASSTPATSAR